MSDFEEKDAIMNAAFDKFMSDGHLVIRNEESRALFFEIFVGGAAFMIQQLGKEMGFIKEEQMQ